MTTLEQNIAVAELYGARDRWTIMKHGLYYRPNAKGYTNCLSEAWIVTESVADQHVYPYDTPVSKHRAPLLDYVNDLNAVRAAIKAHPVEIQKAVRSVVWQLSSQMDVLPPASVFTEALLRVTGKWIK